MSKMKVCFYTETIWWAQIFTLWFGLLFSKGEDVLFSQIFFFKRKHVRQSDLTDTFLNVDLLQKSFYYAKLVEKNMDTETYVTVTHKSPSLKKGKFISKSFTHLIYHKEILNTFPTGKDYFPRIFYCFWKNFLHLLSNNTCPGKNKIKHNRFELNKCHYRRYLRQKVTIKDIIQTDVLFYKL